MPRTLAAAYGVRAIDLFSSLPTRCSFTSAWWTEACIGHGLAPEIGAAILRDLLLEEAVVNRDDRYTVVLDPLTVHAR